MAVLTIPFTNFRFVSAIKEEDVIKYKIMFLFVFAHILGHNNSKNICNLFKHQVFFIILNHICKFLLVPPAPQMRYT